MRYFLALLLAASATMANAANFISLHQTPLRIALPPAAGSYDYTFSRPVGFKAQYAPTGVSGCAIGFGTGGCAFSGGGSLALPEFTGYQLQASEFKVFIPAGTKSFMFTGYAPQGALSAFVMRYGAAPTRVATLSGAEYQATMAAEKIDTVFSRLVSTGAEQLVVHDGGGTVRFVGGQLDANRGSTNQGKWLYIRQLNGSQLYDVQGGLDVDMPKFAAGYAQIQWNTSTYPDPVEAATAPVTTVPDAGTPGTITPGVTYPGTNPGPASDTLTTAVVSGAGQPLKLDVTLTQALANIPAGDTASAWFGVRIPASLFFVDSWYFRTETTWAQLPFLNMDAVAYKANVANAPLLKFTPSFDFTAEELNAYRIEIHFGYKTKTGAFVNKGKIWPQ